MYQDGKVEFISASLIIILLHRKIQYFRNYLLYELLNNKTGSSCKKQNAVGLKSYAIIMNRSL